MILDSPSPPSGQDGGQTPARPPPRAVSRFAHLILGITVAWCATHAAFEWQLGGPRVLITGWSLGGLGLLATMRFVGVTGRLRLALSLLPLLVGLHAFELYVTRTRPPAATAAE